MALVLAVGLAIDAGGRPSCIDSRAIVGSAATFPGPSEPMIGIVATGAGGQLALLEHRLNEIGTILLAVVIIGAS